MSIVEKLLAEVKRALKRMGVTSEERLVVACSFGPDSLALADALLELKARGQVGPIVLVYIDHGLRPECVLKDEALRVSALARARGAEAQVVKVTVDRTRRGGLEEAARVARYDALERISSELGVRWVALGHTASDQAETVLMRLMSGAGTRGLAGMPRERDKYIRPLLGIYRTDICQYLEARALVPAHDDSNDSSQFRRNRIRHEILPVLRTDNPRVDEALVRAAYAMREATEVIDWAARRELETLVVARAEAELKLDALALKRLPRGLTKRILALSVADWGILLESRHLEALLDLVAREAAGTVPIALPGVSVRREYEALTFARYEEKTCRPQVTVEGEDGPYEVRSWRPGDRMRPHRLRGHSRKLQDLFVDAKVPRVKRRTALVVVRVKDGEIVWAEHVGPAVATTVRVVPG